MLPFYVYDVFTDRPYTGNPLAIVEGAEGLSTVQMQTMAREFNLSETIFIFAPDDPANTAKVRIFTPDREMPFAGHPTIGCAIHLASREGDEIDTEILLEEQAGLTPVRVWGSNGACQAEFVAPIEPGTENLNLTQGEIAAAIGLMPSDIGPHLAHITTGGHPFLHICLQGQDALSRAAPAAGWARMVEVADTASAYLYTKGDEFDFEARMFSPKAIGEDPATGSATALLSAQLLANNALPDGQTSFALRQGRDMGRPSRLTLTTHLEAGRIKEVRVAGSAVPVSSGQIQPPS